MAAAEFGALLLADFDHRLDLQNANRLRPSPHPFGARNPGPFGGGPQAVIPAHARTRDLPAPSHFMLHVMAGGIDSLESHDRPVASTSASASNAAAAAVPGAPDFKPASSTISAHHRAAFAESSTMAQKRRLLEDSAGLECSFMGVGTGTGPWDAGSEETARRVATLQARLQQRLGPEYVSSRAGPSGGPKVSYIEGWKAIDLANDVFGFNGWSSSIVNIDVDYLEEHPETGRVNVGVSVTVRVTLRDGTFHEDVGYGSMDNSKSRAAALEKSKKEAVTDALKRTLRTFGRVLGNCLYDKQFLRDVSKVSLPPVKFDPSTLHRRPEFAQAAAGKKPPTTTSEHAEPATTGASASSSTTMPPPPIPAPAPALVRTATAPAPRSVAPNTTSRANAVSDQAQTASPSKPASNPALVRSRTMGPGPVSANSTVLAPRTAGPSVPAGNASVPSDKSHSAQTSVREATSTSTSQAGAEAAAAIAAAATMSAADKARLAEQRRMEAQKRLARTKSMHAGVVGANTTTESAAHTSSVGGAAGTSPAKSALVPGRIEVPTFGPQLGRVSKAESAGAGRASPMNSTPFGPRFVQKSKYPDDSAVFFPDDDDHGEEEEGEQSMEGGGGGSGKKRMLLQENHGAAMGAGEDGLGEGGGADRSVRGPSVGRFTGLTPNSAQLLRSGTTSLSSAAGPVSAGHGHGHGHGHGSTTNGQASGEKRKHSLCGPLQPRRPNHTTAANHFASVTDVGGPSSGGIENLGLAERVSGVGVGVGKVRGVAVAGGGVGAGAGAGAGGMGGGIGGGFAPASAAGAGRWSAGSAGNGVKRAGEGMGGAREEYEMDSSKRVRR